MIPKDARIRIIDLETTGLLLDAGHEPYEFGVITREDGETTERLWRSKPELAKADPEALRVNRYYEATKAMSDAGGMIPPHLCDLAADVCQHFKHTTGVGRWLHWSHPSLIAASLARMIDGAIVVGCNPGFDKDFLRPFLHRYGQAYTAHYRPMWVTTMGYGFLCGRGLAGGLRWPLSSSEVSKALGVDPDDYDRHSALGGCRWALAQLEVITGGAG